MKSNIPRQNILGVEISAINMKLAIETIAGWIKAGSPNYVCVTPAHSVMDCLDDVELREIFNQSGMTTPDGMSIVWLLKLHGQKQVERVYGPDLMLAVCQRGLDAGWRHYFYGGAPGVGEALVERLRERCPGLQVAGHYSPPFRELTLEEDHEITALIQEAKPDVVWVGISSPKQERWMHAHVDKLGAPVLAGVGAAFDFLSGNKKQAPRWMQRSGLEWLYRLLTEPKRLWRRYKRYPRFVLLAAAQLLGFSWYDKEED